MNWTNVTVKLSDLQPWEHNPRMMTKRKAAQLLKSWKTLGQFQTVAIGPHGEVYDGHQRLNALSTIYPADYEIEARQSERELSEDERAALTLAANLPAGAWDWSKLAQWDTAQIREWGMDAEQLQAWNNDAANLATMLDIDNEDIEDDKYSKKVTPPIYTPKGEQPALSELYDETKYNKLKAEIEAAELSEGLKQFLIVAAQRHTVINFQKVAEYYCHASPDVQRLMENSALVIIDFDKAIEQGYVILSQEILDIQNDAR